MALIELLSSLTLWPLIIIVPLALTWNDNYATVFPKDWYDMQPVHVWGSGQWPSPLGLSLGILAVVVGQIMVLIFFTLRRGKQLGSIQAIQKEGAPKYIYREGLMDHLSQPEGFIMLGGYLIGTWMFGLMPASYYSFAGGINWLQVFMQLVIQDTLQATMHYIEHTINPAFYRVSHKPHHRFTNPKLFDAFNGSVADTFFMILLNLALTARLVNANVWSYMAFGSLYANWLVLIHSEYVNPWDGLFRLLGFGTAADHHVHHKLFVFNYGHLFMYWDYVMGTYRNPAKVTEFNKGV